jgi:hypothetical protein
MMSPKNLLRRGNAYRILVYLSRRLGAAPVRHRFLNHIILLEDEVKTRKKQSLAI